MKFLDSLLAGCLSGTLFYLREPEAGAIVIAALILAEAIRPPHHQPAPRRDDDGGEGFPSEMDASRHGGRSK